MKQRRFQIVICIQADRLEQAVDVLDQFRDAIAARGCRCAETVRTLSYEGFAAVTAAEGHK